MTSRKLGKVKVVLVTASIMLTLSGSTAGAAASTAGRLAPWSVELKNWQVDGTFDYQLYYPNGQLESLVSAPQHQLLPTIAVAYNLSDKAYVSVAYANSLFGSKGTGADADWQSGQPDQLWYYGNTDFYGTQSAVNVDLGRVTAESSNDRAKVYVGWSSHESLNELRNTSYHIINYQDVGNQTQPDNGSTLDAKFQGPHIGIEYVHKAGDRLAVNSRVQTSYLNASAHGEWNNHDPAWDWDNYGAALGYQAAIGVNYKINPDVSAEVGYQYYYAKMNGGDEQLNTGDGAVTSTGAVDLRYIQQGVYYGVKALF